MINRMKNQLRKNNDRDLSIDGDFLRDECYNAKSVKIGRGA